MKQHILKQRTVISFYVDVYIDLVSVGLDNNLNTPLLLLWLASDIILLQILKSNRRLHSFAFNCRSLDLRCGRIPFSARPFRLVPLFVVHSCREYLNALQSDSIWSAEPVKQQCQLLTMHWQKTGQDQQTSAVVRY